MLFTAPCAAEFISGAIMHDETIRQKSSDGTPLIQVLSRQGIRPGIKVDAGAKPLAGAADERVTEGSTGCGIGSRSATAWAPASRSGGRLFGSRTPWRAPLAGVPMRKRSRGKPR